MIVSLFLYSLVVSGTLPSIALSLSDRKVKQLVQVSVGELPLLISLYFVMVVIVLFTHTSWFEVCPFLLLPLLQSLLYLLL